MKWELLFFFLTQYSSFNELVSASNLAYLYARRHERMQINGRAKRWQIE